MGIKFNNQNELYNRLLPALNTREIEMKSAGFEYISCEDIWNYLKEYKWSKSSNLTLHKMVDDILEIDHVKIDDYLKIQFKNRKKKIIDKDDSIL